MDVVDAHLHLWDTVANPYPWLSGAAHGSEERRLAELFPRYLAAEYEHDCGDRVVTATVHVQAEWERSDPVGETRWLQALHDREGIPDAIVGAVELESESAPETLAAHLRHPAFRGIRQLLAWHQDPALSSAARPDLIEDAAWRRGFALLAPLGLSFDLTVYPAQLAPAAALAADFPTTSIILDHVGLPDAVGPDRAVWSEGMRRLAACENVTVKLSGLALPGRSIDQMAEYAEEALALFGCERAMYGSNLPVEHLGGSADMVVDAIERSLARRTPAEREAVWQATARRVYRLP